MVAVAEGDPAVVVATLRQALEALSRLSADRAALEEALKVPPPAPALQPAWRRGQPRHPDDGCHCFPAMRRCASAAAAFHRTKCAYRPV